VKTEYFEKYLQQKEKLPSFYYEKIEEKVLFYAFSDFDHDFQSIEKWIVVTATRLYVFENKLENSYFIDDLKVREGKGHGINNLTLLSESKEVLEVIWYGQRQNIVFAQLKYLLEEKNINFSKSADEIYQEGLLKPLLKKQASTEVDKNKVVWRLLSYLGPYKGDVIIGSIGAVLATLTSLVPAYLSGKIIDDIIQPFQDGNLDSKEAMSIGFVLVATLGITYFLREIFIWLRLKKMSVMGEMVARDLRRDLFNHIQKLDMDFFANNHTGSIISRISSDTDRIWDFVAFGVVEVSIAILSLVTLSAMLIGLDFKLGLLMTIPVPVILYAIYLHGEKMKKIFLRCWRKWSDVTAVLSDAIPGMQVVKSFNQEEREMKRFAKRNQAAIDVFVEVHDSWTKFWPILFFFVHVIMVSVWAFAIPRLVATPDSSVYISAGTFVSFLLYMTMFLQPIEVIGQMARMLNRATSSAYRIFEILDTKPSMDTKSSVDKIKLNGKIDFADVIFSYDGVRNVLKGINFNIEKGEMIGLVGPSGSGKSTITKLLNRFYDISSGSIKLDGIDIKNLDVGFMRRQIAVVHQDPYLFHGTILDNIRYGNENADLSEVIKACKIANSHEFIMGFKDAYDTTVGERGQTLSGGERQRISIARAILNNPRILILDEATSAVDTETERKIQDALDKLIEGRTVIAIAHRLSTLRKANRIFVVKAGNIEEVGTHKELMEMNGEYRKLQDMQTEMFNLMHGDVEDPKLITKVIEGVKDE